MLALVAGRPIIASDIGNFSEILENDRTALLVPPDSPNELAQAMARLIAQDALRSGMAHEVRALRQRIPTWDQIGGMTLDLYRRLA
jgi:glycosyltransferase involved in cell wall biosynthesis